MSENQKFIRNIYTRVLKGHISVVKSNLNKIKQEMKLITMLENGLNKLN